MKSLLVVLLLTAATAQGEIYTWKDLKGTAHFTNSMDEIPVRYRTRVKVLNYETEQKKDPSTQPQNSLTQQAPSDQPAAPVAGATHIRKNASSQPETGTKEGVQLKNHLRKSPTGRGRRKTANVPEE